MKRQKTQTEPVQRTELDEKGFPRNAWAENELRRLRRAAEEKIEDTLTAMRDGMVALSMKRDAFFRLLVDELFVVYTPEATKGTIPVVARMPIASRYIPAQEMEIQLGLGRRVLVINPSDTRPFRFKVEQFGTALEVRVDAQGENNPLLEGIEDLMSVIENVLNVTAKRQDNGISLIIRLDAERIFDNSMHLEDALRAVALIYDRAVERNGSSKLH